MPEASVAEAEVMVGTGLSTLSDAEPDADGEATLTAVTVTGFVAGMLDGGVYTPELMIVPTELLPPLMPATCHVTAVFVRFVTVALKLAVPPSLTWLDPLTVTEACAPPPFPPPPEFMTLLVQPVRRRRMPNAD